MTDTLWSTVLDFGDPDPEEGPVPEHRLEWCPNPILFNGEDLFQFRIIVSGDSEFSLQWPYGGLEFLDSVVRTYTEIISLSGDLEVPAQYPVRSISSIIARGFVVRKDEEGVLHLHAEDGDTLSGHMKLGKIVFSESYYGLVEITYSVYFKRYEHPGVLVEGSYYVNVVYPAPLIVNGEVTGHKNIYTPYEIPIGTGVTGTGIISGDTDLCDLEE